MFVFCMCACYIFVWRFENKLWELVFPTMWVLGIDVRVFGFTANPKPSEPSPPSTFLMLFYGPRLFMLFPRPGNTFSSSQHLLAIFQFFRFLETLLKLLLRMLGTFVRVPNFPLPDNMYHCSQTLFPVFLPC